MVLTSPFASLSQSFIDFPPPPAAQVGFDSSTAVVVNGALTAFDPNTVEIVFSKLDESVERERRIARARQAWSLFVRDVSQRSKATMGTCLPLVAPPPHPLTHTLPTRHSQCVVCMLAENVNFIRAQTYYSHFVRIGPRIHDPWLVYSPCIPTLVPSVAPANPLVA